jgi:hypothetical protein
MFQLRNGLRTAAPPLVIIEGRDLREFNAAVISRRSPAVHDGKREAKQQRAALITVTSRAAKKGFREKDQEKRKVAVYNRKSILEPPRKGSRPHAGRFAS